MQIGEFAKVCGTKISVLRHYDKEGLLRPEHIDRFTGYRYYSKEQIGDYLKILALKSAGFSLAEIRSLLIERKTREEILKIFEKKRAELQKTLMRLDTARTEILGVEQMIKIKITEAEQGITIKAKTAGEETISELCAQAEEAIAAEGYQRISPFSTQKDPKDGTTEAVCDAVKLTDAEILLQENIDLPFENDDRVIGKWEIVGEFAVKEDFYAHRRNTARQEEAKEIYFLPDGERYWCYGWTKGKLLLDDGVSTSVNAYTTEKIGSERYMFVDFKSWHYRHGGKTTMLVLRQIDNKNRTAEQIAKKDNIDLPFIPDEKILGKWKAVDFCGSREEFLSGENTKNGVKSGGWYFSEVEFRPEGKVISRYDYGREEISSKEMQEWTKGYVLRKWNHTACAYEILNRNGREYLLMEWKSGDYRWGGFDTDYYVFVRE